MKKDMIVHEAPKSAAAEAIRNLRTSIMYKKNQTEAKSFLFTSSATEDGKSWIISNLAIAFAQSKQKVLVIDCDLRRGRQHEIFNVDNSVGLTNALENKKICKDSVYLDEEIDSIILKTEIDNVYVIPAGMVPHNPAELLENNQFTEIVNYVYDRFDIILFDSPPINVVTDTMILCNKADGVVMVCAIEKSRREALIETKKKIESMGGNLLGVVINWMPLDKIKEYTKAYGKYSENQIVKYSDRFKNISM